MAKPQMPITQTAVARTLRARWTTESQVVAYYDQMRHNVIAVVEALGAPHPLLATYSTSSLHAFPNVMDGRDIRVELLVVGNRSDTALANVVATSAFCVMKDHWLAAPGVVFPNAVLEYFPFATTKHVVWVEPFDYDDLSSIVVPGIDYQVHVLQGLPITDAEYGLLRDQGFDALERALSEAHVEHFDLVRKSAV